MITESMKLASKSDARTWAAQYDLDDAQTERLANWIWANKPTIGCSLEEHPLSSLTDEAFCEIVYAKETAADLDGTTLTGAQIETLRSELMIGEDGYFVLTEAQFSTISEDGNQQPTSRCLPDHLEGSLEYAGPAVITTSLGKVRIQLSYIFDEDELAAAGDDEGNLPWDFAHSRRCMIAAW